MGFLHDKFNPFYLHAMKNNGIFAHFLRNMKKTGLYFGSFNPIHIGHLVIAEFLVENSDLDEIWFVVSPQNPLKKKRTLLDDRQRLHLVNIAIDDDLRFKACDVEFSLPKPSYTSYTLQVLRERYPQRQFSLIMGEDNLQTFDKWFNYEHIIENYHIYVYPRPGYNGGRFAEHRNVTMVEAPLMEISSTMIRESIKSGKSVKYMLPDKVYRHIDEAGFYTK